MYGEIYRLYLLIVTIPATVHSIREDGGLNHQRSTPRQTDPELQVYDPWGKSGAGAPMRDQAGALVTSRPKREVSYSKVIAYWD